MKKQNYFRKKLSEQPEWLENYAVRLIEFGPVLPLAPATVTAGVADARFLAYSIGDWLTQVREYGPGCTSALETLKYGTGTAPFALPVFTAPALPDGVTPVPPGALDRLFSLVQIIKNLPGYTPEIGMLMGIVGSEDATEHTMPTFRIQNVPGAGMGESIKITFRKYRHAGVAIYSQRGSGGWELIATPLSSPYLDERPLLVAGQPEVRAYRLRFWDGSENGELTDISDITVAP